MADLKPWEDKTVGYLIKDALIGEAFCARMCADNPDISEETRAAFLWAESQFIRIAYGHVSEMDLIG
jgi:hypothetical protein